MRFRLIAWAIAMLMVASRAEYGHDQPFDSSKHRPIEVISIVGEVSSSDHTHQLIPLTMHVAETLRDELCDAPTATKHRRRSEEDSRL
jgi:hypothetical protein